MDFKEARCRVMRCIFEPGDGVVHRHHPCLGRHAASGRDLLKEGLKKN